MRIFFGGAEQPAWRKLLTECGVENVALSFHQLRSRLPKTKTYLIADRFQEGQNIFLDSGAFAANKGDVKDPEEHIHAYFSFVQNNIDRIDYVSEFDALSLGYEEICRWRRVFWDSLPPDKFVPVWHESYGLDELVRLCDTYENVGVTATTTDITHRLNSLVVRTGTNLHALGVTNLDLIHSVRFSSFLSTSWSSPMRYGDTIIWDGHRLRRYPRKYQSQARKKHRMLFKKAGFDPDLILADDRNEVLRFTIWSWRQLEGHMTAHRPNPSFRRIRRDDVATTSTNGHAEQVPEVPEGPVATQPHQNGKSAALVPAETMPLPVFGFREVETKIKSDQGEETQMVRVAVLAKTSQRQCDSCYLSATCPAFEEGSACKFNLPIEIQTKDQLLSSMTSLLEMQMQRVAFGRFAEELEGGYPDPNISNEMDRLFHMVRTFKDIQDDSAKIKMTLEARGQTGVLNQLFGDRSKVLQNLSDPLDEKQTDKFLQDVIDGEVIEE